MASSMATAVAITWGLCFVLIQAAMPGSTPLLSASLRSLAGGAALAVWLGFPVVVGRLTRGSGSSRRAAGRRRLPSWGILASLAILNSTLAFGAMYLSAGRAEAAVASILAGGQPLALAAGAWLFFSERPSPATLGGLFLAMAGVVLIASTGSGTTQPGGVALAVVAATAPAGGTILMRRIGANVDLLATTSAQFLLGGILLAFASAVTEPLGAVRPSPSLLIDIVVLGLAGTGAAYVAWFWLLARVSLMRLATLLYLVPITGVVTAILVGDRPSPMQLAGIGTILAGILVAGLLPTRRRPRS